MPSVTPEWATDSTFSSGPIIGQPNKADPGSGMRAEGFDPTDPAAAEHVNFLLNNIGDWMKSTLACIIGDGSDGDATLDGTNTVTWASKSGSTYTATRDVYCDDLSITTASTLKMAGYRLFVRGVLTIDAGCFVQNNGSDGAGAVAGAGGAAGSMLGGGDGGAGVAAGAPGNAGAATTSSAGASGGAGGTGNLGANAAGSAGTATAPVAARGGFRHLYAATNGYIVGDNAGTATLTALKGGGGGGSGGGGTAGASGAGGGGGGVLVVACYRLVNEGTIRANGGNGVTSTIGTGPNSGGGGGGGGGVVFLIRGGKSGAGTVTASGGTHGNGEGSGANGADGSAGSVIELGLT